MSRWSGRFKARERVVMDAWKPTARSGTIIRVQDGPEWFTLAVRPDNEWDDRPPDPFGFLQPHVDSTGQYSEIWPMVSCTPEVELEWAPSVVPAWVIRQTGVR